MRRRAFLGVVCGAVAWPLAAAAQQSTNSKRLAIFSPSEPSADLHARTENRFSRALFAELRRLGQIEGQNLKVESYGREQNTSGLEAKATEIVQSNPDVIFLAGPGALIFKRLTSRIPIVTITGDPVQPRDCRKSGSSGRQFHGSQRRRRSIHSWKTDSIVARDDSCDVETWLPRSSIAMGGIVTCSNPFRSGRRGGPPYRGVLTGNRYQRGGLPGCGREHLPRRCKCGHGRRFA